jgi:hypothetical protein
LKNIQSTTPDPIIGKFIKQVKAKSSSIGRHEVLQAEKLKYL